MNIIVDMLGDVLVIGDYVILTDGNRIGIGKLKYTTDKSGVMDVAYYGGETGKKFITRKSSRKQIIRTIQFEHISFWQDAFENWD